MLPFYLYGSSNVPYEHHTYAQIPFVSPTSTSMQSALAPVGDAPILIRDKIPLRLWLATGAGMMERAAYYGSMIMTRWWAPKPREGEKERQTN